MLKKLFVLFIVLGFCSSAFAQPFVAKGGKATIDDVDANKIDVPVSFYINDASTEANNMYTKVYPFTSADTFTVAKVTNRIKVDLGRISNYETGVTPVIAVGTKYGTTWSVTADAVNVSNGFVNVTAVVRQSTTVRATTVLSIFCLEYSAAEIRNQMVEFRDYVMKRKTATVSDFEGVIVTP